jgi:uncharacterized iron-regulated membrane protein
MLRSLRPILFWCHLACGVTAGVVIFIMCVTGAALMYQREVQLWADTHTYRTADPAGAPEVSASAIVAAAEASAAGDESATSLVLRADPTMPAAVTVGSTTLYVNPHTTTVYGEGTGDRLRAFFTTMTSWHRYMAASLEDRATGRMVTGAANFIFLFIVMSGIVLWWPRSLRWGAIRNGVWFRRGLTPKARDFNWHHVFGFWSAVPLLVIVSAGVVMSYPWANGMLYRAMGEEPPAQGARGGGPGRGRGAGPGIGREGRGAGPGVGREGRSARAEGPRGAAAGGGDRNQVDAAARPGATIALDAAVARAKAADPDWQILTFRLPESVRGALTVTVDRGDGGEPQRRGTLTLDAATGTVTAWEAFSSQTPGRRARSFVRFAHTGEVAGFLGQTIAGIASAGGAFLAYTGIALAMRRLLAWRRTRRRRVESAAA